MDNNANFIGVKITDILDFFVPLRVNREIDSYSGILGKELAPKIYQWINFDKKWERMLDLPSLIFIEGAISIDGKVDLDINPNESTFPSNNKVMIGDKLWFKNGKQHRDHDLPAVECGSGDKYWCKNGECHRDNDLPAIEYISGNKCWLQYGQLHRENDLPAVIGPSIQKWYTHGNFVKEENLNNTTGEATFNPIS